MSFSGYATSFLFFILLLS